MNLEEWRKNPERLSLALDMMNQQTMKEMLAVMEIEHPGRRHERVSDGFGATRVLGRIEGFQEALEMLRSFSQPIPKPHETIPVTWNAEPDSAQQS